MAKATAATLQTIEELVRFFKDFVTNFEPYRTILHLPEGLLYLLVMSSELVELFLHSCVNGARLDGGVPGRLRHRPALTKQQVSQLGCLCLLLRHELYKRVLLGEQMLRHGVFHFLLKERRLFILQLLNLVKSVKHHGLIVLQVLSQSAHTI